MPSLWSIVALICASLLWVSPALAAGIQYCANEPPLCLGVAHKVNDSTQGHDVYVTLSATPSENGGWTAVGIGKLMMGALMFVVYADRDRTSLTTSIRAGTGNVMPTVLTDHPNNVAVLNTSISQSNYYAQFVCYSCDAWWPEPIEMERPVSFIYAANQDQIFYTAQTNSNLMIHKNYGVLLADMQAASLPGVGDPIPSVAAGKTDGFTRVEANYGSPGMTEEPWLSPVRIHGTIMTIAFMGLFLGGSVVIRLPMARRFKYHWVIQSSASVLALGSALYMFLRSKKFGPHKILGLIVVCSLIAQAALGYKHHTVFVKIRRQSIYTFLHQWLGRSILFLGTLNVGLGMYYRHWSALGLTGWFLVWIAEIGGFAYVVVRAQRRRGSYARGQAVPKMDPDDGVFDLASDESDADEIDVEGVPLMETSNHKGKN